MKHDLHVRGSDHLAAIILRLDAEERAELNGDPLGAIAREQASTRSPPSGFVGHSSPLVYAPFRAYERERVQCRMTARLCPSPMRARASGWGSDREGTSGWACASA